MDAGSDGAALALEGRRILVVDDEFLIATDLCDSFREEGALVSGPHTTLADGLKAAESEQISAAVLDYRLGRDTSDAIADLLMARKIPFLFCSGGGISQSLEQRLPPGTILLKPVSYARLLEALAALTGST